MAVVALDVEQWAKEQFGSCEFGDVRRTERAVKYAVQVAEHPDGSTPVQTEKWSELKGAYRLFSRKEVTFMAVIGPHCQRTRSRAAGICLLLGDTTEIDYGNHRQVPDLGPNGDGDGYGFMLHSSLLVRADTEDIVGLAGQELFYRKPRPKTENSYQRSQRQRESEVWGRVIDEVGPPAPGVTYIHVLDRGADNLEVFLHAQQQRSGWVIRACQLKRCVQDQQGQSCKLQELISQSPVQGTYELKVPAAKKRGRRKAKLEVRFAPVTLLRQRRCPPYAKQLNFQQLKQWVVEVREVSPPSGVKPLHWVLYTSEAVETYADALRIIGYYKRRWLIEEYHKALKTGCHVEERQYRTAKRLEAATGMLSVVAVRLLQIKCIAREKPETPARHVVPRVWLEMLRALRLKPIVTVQDFIRHLAGLGGHMGRKGDGDPGWITLWRGVEKLILCVRGNRAMQKQCG